MCVHVCVYSFDLLCVCVCVYMWCGCVCKCVYVSVLCVNPEGINFKCGHSFSSLTYIMTLYNVRVERTDRARYGYKCINYFQLT